MERFCQTSFTKGRSRAVSRMRSWAITLCGTRRRSFASDARTAFRHGRSRRRMEFTIRTGSFPVKNWRSRMCPGRIHRVQCANANSTTARLHRQLHHRRRRHRRAVARPTWCATATRYIRLRGDSAQPCPPLRRRTICRIQIGFGQGSGCAFRDVNDG